MQLRRFNAEGLRRFESFVHQFRASGGTSPPPMEMLSDKTLTATLPSRIDAEVELFPSRIRFAAWLQESAAASNAVVPAQEPAFWAWLTLLLFEQVAPTNAKGHRTAREVARYLFKAEDPLRASRHALAGPLQLLAAVGDPETAEPLLCGPLSTASDQAYQRFNELSLVHHRGAIDALRALYFNPQTRQMRPGASRGGAGGIFHFTRLLKQYALTYDLDVVPGERIVAMLPPQFDDWKVGGAVTPQVAEFPEGAGVAG